MNTAIVVKKENSTFILILIMILTGIFGLLGTDIYAPSLPLVPILFNTTITLTQMTISAYLIGFGLTQLVAGMLSDNFGRKPILNAGLIVFILGTLLCIVAHSIAVLIIGRVIQGVGAGAIAVLSRIILRDTFSGVKMAKVASYLAAFIVLSPSVAPIIGGLIQVQFGFSAIFVFLLLLALILAYFVKFHFMETNRFVNNHSLSINTVLANYKRVLSCKVFWVNVIATGTALATIVSCAVVNPFLLQNRLHMSPAHYGLWAFIAMLGLFVGMLLNGFLVERFGVRRMMLAGMGIILMGGIVFVLLGASSTLSIASVIIPTFFITMAASFILPNAIVDAFTPFADIAGTAGAVYGCLQILITSLATAVVAFVDVHSQLSLGLVLIGLMIVSMVPRVGRLSISHSIHIL